MKEGNHRQLNQEDLWRLKPANQSKELHKQFKHNLGATHGAIVPALVRTYGRPVLICGLASFFTVACDVFAPVVLNHVIDAFAAPALDIEGLLSWLGAFFASRLVNAVISSHNEFRMEIKVGLRLTAALKTMIFDKLLRCSRSGKRRSKEGDIANLLTTDIDTVMWASFVLNKALIMPLQIVVVIYSVSCDRCGSIRWCWCHGRIDDR